MIRVPPPTIRSAECIWINGVSAAEEAYTKKLNEPQEDMQNWFFHKAEKNLLAGL